MYATRARWRVDWCSGSGSGDDTEGKSEEKMLESVVDRSRSKSREVCDGAGEMGNNVGGGTRTGNVVVVVVVGFCGGEEDDDVGLAVDEESEGSTLEASGEEVSDCGVGMPVGSP